MKVVKLEVEGFKLSKGALALQKEADLAWKSLMRVERHVRNDLNGHMPVPNQHLLTESGKARIERAKAKHTAAQAAYVAAYDSEHSAWLEAGKAEIEKLLLDGQQVEVTKDQRELIDYALTRVYESTFGQTSAGCHSAYAVRMNAHGIPWPEQETVILSPTECTEVVWCMFWPPALREQMLEAVGQAPVVTMDNENLAYQRELLRG